MYRDCIGHSLPRPERPFLTLTARGHGVCRSLFRVTVMTLAPRDLVHFLCLHGTKHVWCRLAWLTDLVWFIRGIHCSIGKRCWRRRAQTELARMVLVGLALAHELFGGPLDESVVRRIHADREVLCAVRNGCGGVSSPETRTFPQDASWCGGVMRTRERRRAGPRFVLSSHGAPPEQPAGRTTFRSPPGHI